MDTPIIRAEYEEFKTRLEQGHTLQNERIEALENDVREIKTLTANVERLALSMENMMREQEKQGRRLEKLENRDGEMWRKAIGYVITAIISITIGFIFSKIGM